MKSLLLFALALSPAFVFSQSAYFQQEVNYTIEVRLDDRAHMLRGHEQFEYINNSPETLNEIYIHLWPNAYKNSRTAMSRQKFRMGDYFMLWAPATSRGYIDSLDFAVDGVIADWAYYQDYQDIAVLKLKTPLEPGKSVVVSTPFRVRLPSGSISRLGHVGESYQITQWYPKPAVYDRNGWHPMPYLTQGEFYSEYGSFDVSITLPENYTVGATGDLQTPSEQKRLDSLSRLPLPADDSNVFPPSSTTPKTLRYTQQNVHDFGWFADKRWIVRKGSVVLPHGKDTVTTWAMFTPDNAQTWDKAGIKAINDGLYHYSLWSGDYPYQQCTAVDGTISAGGGMEYPNVTVIGSSPNEQSLATVIVHEVGHNWFYGILGSNERENPWMDEGINSFFETRTMLATNDSLSALSMVGIDNPQIAEVLGLDGYSYQYLTEELAYLLSARGNNDQPMQLPAQDYSSLNYGTIVYKKTAIAFNYIMNYLGEERFNLCMKTYFDRWKFRHPQPADIRKVFEEVSGEDLGWFFDTLVNTKGKVDYAAVNVSRKDDGYRLRVANRGDIQSPFSVDVLRDDKLVSRQWFKGLEPMDGDYVQVKAERGDVIKVNNVQGIPEFDRNNNTIRTKGLWRKVEPIRVSPLSSLDNPDRTQLFWVPLVGWNNYDKWMLGIQLHNQTIPARNFNWSFAPMYSIVTNNVNGFLKMEYWNGKFGAGVRGQKFSYNTVETTDTIGFHDTKTRVYSYQLIAPYLRFNLFPNRAMKDWSGEASLTWFMIGAKVKKDDSDITSDFLGYPTGSTTLQPTDPFHHLRAKAIAIKKLPRSEWRFQAMVEAGEYSDWAVVHQYAVSNDFVYAGRHRSKIRSRIYYGKTEDFYLYASGQRTDSQTTGDSPYNRQASDYAYDALFLGRSETAGLLSQQLHRSQGALAAPTYASANQHLASVNVEIDIPVKLPIGIYGGMAWLKNSADTHTLLPGYPATNTAWRSMWNAGVSLPLIRGIFQVYVPVLYSDNIRREVDDRGLSFGETILFELNLNLANPFELIRKIDR